MNASSGALSGATIAVGFAGHFVQLLEIPAIAAALGVIASLAIVAPLGIRQASVTNIVMTLVEVGGLVFVVIAAAPSLGDVDLMTPAAGGAHGLAIAAGARRRRTSAQTWTTAKVPRMKKLPTPGDRRPVSGRRGP